MNPRIKYFLKQYFKPILIASLLTLVAYIALYAIWGALLSGIKTLVTLRLVLIALMTTTAYAGLLLFIYKIRGSVGEEEVIADYKEREYISIKEDLKVILQREKGMLLSIAVIVAVCCVLNSIDAYLIGVKVISLPTFFFASMCLFANTFNLPFVGYAISILLDCAFYILFLLLYRKKKYRAWYTKE